MFRSLCKLLSRGIISRYGKEYLDLKETARLWQLADMDIDSSITYQEIVKLRDLDLGTDLVPFEASLLVTLDAVTLASTDEALPLRLLRDLEGLHMESLGPYQCIELRIHENNRRLAAPEQGWRSRFSQTTDAEDDNVPITEMITEKIFRGEIVQLEKAREKMEEVAARASRFESAWNEEREKREGLQSSLKDQKDEGSKLERRIEEMERRCLAVESHNRKLDKELKATDRFLGALLVAPVAEVVGNDMLTEGEQRVLGLEAGIRGVLEKRIMRRDEGLGHQEASSTHQAPSEPDLSPNTVERHETSLDEGGLIEGYDEEEGLDRGFSTSVPSGSSIIDFSVLESIIAEDQAITKQVESLRTEEEGLESLGFLSRTQELGFRDHSLDNLLQLNSRSDVHLSEGSIMGIPEELLQIQEEMQWAFSTLHVDEDAEIPTCPSTERMLERAQHDKTQVRRESRAIVKGLANAWRGDDKTAGQFAVTTDIPPANQLPTGNARPYQPAIRFIDIAN